MKKTTLFIANYLLLFNCAYLQAQTIAPYLFGQNAWMPDYIGSNHLNGQLDNQWQKVKDSRCVSVRIGGIAYDQNDQTITSPINYITQLCSLINTIQLNGGEPQVQISYNNGAFNATQAYNIVTAINVTNLSSIQRKVKYWFIGNEPDGQYTSTNQQASGIAAYIIAFSSEMKRADPSIKIIAPELAYYNSKGGNIYEILTDGTNGLLQAASPISPNDITGSGTYGYYVDYISFHYYPFGPPPNQAFPTSNLDIATKITSAGGFATQLSNLSTKLTAANSAHSRTGSNQLQIAITEGNMLVANTTTAGDTVLSGMGSNSFIAGQFWAEMLATCMKNNVQFMNFWSVIEGSAGSWVSDKGYLRPVNASKRSTWYHFELLANNFKGTYTVANYTNGQPDFKAFGSYNSQQIAVMVTNQNAASYSYSLNLGTGTSGSNPIRVNFASGMGLSKYYDRTIPANSSTLFVFDPNGNISQETNYGLSNNWAAPANTCGTPFSCINQTTFDAYSPGVHSTVTIGGAGAGQGPILLDATHNTVFKSTGLLTITGIYGSFSSNNQTLVLTNSICE
jgi:hypothetical protein